MTLRNITDHFKRLGAPLRVPMKSWGAVRSDGKVILRVWQDRHQTIDGITYVQLIHIRNREDDWGFDERVEHVELIANGHECLMVVCQVKDPKAERRYIKTYNDREVRKGGQLININGETWIEVGERIPVEDIKLA